MSPSFLVEILCYICTPFTITSPSPSQVFICAGHYLNLKVLKCYNVFFFVHLDLAL